ncbi:unnamed protein product [Durusdinium trenchii]|uniref:SURF1-like protein n=1 Tax=Durusdinium trenchii TaxID=1381693 RepID=A0ABP0LDJ0_9DINO
MLQTDWRLQRQLCVVLPGCFGRRHVGCHSERFSARGSAGNGCCEGSAPGSMALGGDWLASLWPKRYFSRPAEDGVQPDAASCGVDRTGAGPGRCGLHVWLPALGLCAREGGLPEVEGDYPGITSLWIFWMPKQGRWLLANVKPGGTGVQSVVARSLADDGSTWACFWPWEVEAEGWESPTADTIGLEDADAIWVPNRDIAVRLASPAIVIGTVDDLGAPPVIICGFYEPRGMANGRVYYVMVPEDISLERSTGPMCLWFAESVAHLLTLLFSGVWTELGSRGASGAKVIEEGCPGGSSLHPSFWVTPAKSWRGSPPEPGGPGRRISVATPVRLDWAQHPGRRCHPGMAEPLCCGERASTGRWLIRVASSVRPTAWWWRLTVLTRRRCGPAAKRPIPSWASTSAVDFWPPDRTSCRPELPRRRRARKAAWMAMFHAMCFGMVRIMSSGSSRRSSA